MLNFVKLPTYQESDRVGRFSIARQFALEYRSEVLRVMGKCAVFRAEPDLARDVITYVAISDHFDVLPGGNSIPEYQWLFSDDGYMWCERARI